MKLHKCPTCNHANPSDFCRFCAGMIGPPVKVKEYHTDTRWLRWCVYCGETILRKFTGPHVTCSQCKRQRNEERRKGIIRHGPLARHKYQYHCDCPTCLIRNTAKKHKQQALTDSS